MLSLATIQLQCFLYKQYARDDRFPRGMWSKQYIFKPSTGQINSLIYPKKGQIPTKLQNFIKIIIYSNNSAQFYKLGQILKTDKFQVRFVIGLD